MIDQADIVTLITAATIGSLVVLALAADRRQQQRRRVAERLSRYCLNTEDERPALRRQTVLQQLSAMVLVLGRPIVAGLFSQEKDRIVVRQLLWSAGFRHDGALSMLAAAKAAAAIAAAAAAYVVVVRGGLLDAGSLVDILAVAGAAVIGGIVPEYALRWVAGERRNAIRESLPDAIDLMVIAAQAGLSLDMAVDRVTREMKSFAPALAGELSITMAELQALPDRTEALQNLGDRTGIREVQTFSLALIQTIRYGTPFAASLKALGQDLRQARMIALEERGAKLPALLSLPLILFIMPAVFVVVVGPAIISIMESFGE